MDQLARLFRALSDPSRLRILNLLSHRNACVSDLQTVLSLSQPLISRHLAYLRGVRLVRNRREGLHVCYSFGTAKLFSYPLQCFLREVLPHTPKLQSDLAKLAECEGAGRLKARTPPERPVEESNSNHVGEGFSPAPGHHVGAVKTPARGGKR